MDKACKNLNQRLRLKEMEIKDLHEHRQEAEINAVHSKATEGYLRGLIQEQAALLESHARVALLQQELTNVSRPVEQASEVR